MCGRFGVGLPFSTLAKLLRAEPLDEDEDAASSSWGPDFNIAPTDRAPVLRRLPDGRRTLALFRWGLVPFWASDPKVGARMINARGDTVADKPAFRESFKTKRLLVPASGWYEWTHPGPAPGTKKKDLPRPTPHWIASPSDEPLLFAGLWASWSNKASDTRLETFSIITTDAAPSTRAVHDRMPVILDAQQQELWLDPQTPLDVLGAMLGPYPGPLVHHPVDTAVNNVRADGAHLILPLMVPAKRTGELF